MWITPLVFAALSLLAQTAVVVAMAAARRRDNIYFTIAAVSALTAPVAWLAGPALFDRPFDADGRLFLVATHLLTGGFLLHAMTLPDRSVTLRVLVELLLAPDQRLTVAELTDRYGIHVMIESRIHQLRDRGFLDVKTDGEIVLRPRGVLFGRFVGAGRALFAIESAN